MSNQNVFENAAQILYGARAKKDEEEKNLRNSLLNELGDRVEAKHIFYSSNDELKKMRDEMYQTSPKYRLGALAKAADAVDESTLKIPDKKETPPKAKLLDKIPVKKKDSNPYSAQNDQEYQMEPIKASISFDEYANNENEINVSDIKDEQFNKIMKYVYETEGGFIDDPDDRGRRTNRGVTQRSYNDYNKKHNLSQKDVKDITKEEADKIYKEMYWEASGADKIKDKNLAYMHFDAAINHGVGTAKRLLEESGGDFNKYYQGRKQIYSNLSKNPKQQKYYNGWINRIDRINKMRQENVLD